MKTQVVAQTILSGMLAFSLSFLLAGGAHGAAPGLSAPEKETVEKAFPSKPPTRPMPAAVSLQDLSSATPICTPRSRWMRARSAHA